MSKGSLFLEMHLANSDRLFYQPLRVSRLQGLGNQKFQTLKQVSSSFSVRNLLTLSNFSNVRSKIFSNLHLRISVKMSQIIMPL